MSTAAYTKKRKIIMSDTKWKNLNLDAKTIEYYRRNPCIAAEELLGIKLLDSQAYILQNTWNTPNNVWACSRNFGKSFLIAVIAILKAVLYENQNIYIISSVGSQAKLLASCIVICRIIRGQNRKRSSSEDNSELN